MRNNGLFSTLFIEDLKAKVTVDDAARGRLAVLGQTWDACDQASREALWESFIKKALEFLEFVPAASPCAPGLYPLFEDWGFAKCIAVLCLAEAGTDMDDDRIGHFLPGRLVGELKKRKLNWGILTDGATWRLYSLKTSKPYEDYVELDLATDAIAGNDEEEYGLFERFFHKDSFAAQLGDEEDEQAVKEGVYRCRLDDDMKVSEDTLEEHVKKPLLRQVDEVLQYFCNGFIFDTKKSGEEYTEEERRDIFESAVKLVYRCLFLFYAEARKLLPSEDGKAAEYEEHSIRALCGEARKFQWNERKDRDGYDLWSHMKGLIQAVNEGDAQYGVMGYNGGLFDDDEEVFLGGHRLRNDFFARALYLLAYVEPYGGDPDEEYAIPYNDLEVRHLGELYENILEFNVMLADADRIRRRTKKGTEIHLASATDQQKGDTLIKKGQVYFGESALERKQSGSYYTPESLVRFLNYKAIVIPLQERFAADYRERLDEFLKEIESGYDAAARRGAVRSAVALIERFVNEVVLAFRVCDPAMGSGHFLVNAANQMTDLIVQMLSDVPAVEGFASELTCQPNRWRRLVTRHCLYGVDLNPLAVHLAKLSLWLNSFARDHKLTFLDHHLQPGNSLIGIRVLDQLKSLPKRKKEKKRKKHDEFPQFTDLAMAFDEAASRIAAIAQVDEDDTDRMRSLFEEAQEEAQATLAPLADLYTAYLMDGIIDEDSYRQMYGHLAKNGSIDGIGNVDLLETWEAVEGYRDWHDFFHWALAFPEVMKADRGFDAAVGNPPWDMSSANPADFFTTYDEGFRALGRTASLARITQICENSLIEERWKAFQNSYSRQNAYFNNPTAYPNAPTGRNNLFHYFLHRAFDVICAGGHLAFVVPSSIYTDKGCQPLRKLFFTATDIDSLYCFENRWPVVFPAVDNRFKFVTLCMLKGRPTRAFRCAFMQHDPERLSAIDSRALSMSVSIVRQLSPGEMAIPEINYQREGDVLQALYARAPLLAETRADSWNVGFNIEFMSNTDAWRFSTEEADGVPVFAGRCFFFFDDRYACPDRYVAKKHLVETYKGNQQPWKDYRIVFRDIAASTNERTCISTIIPPPSACVETARILFVERADSRNRHPSECLLAGLLNSFVNDFVIRHIVTSHLSQHIMGRLPIMRLDPESPIAAQIAARVLRLLAVHEAFSQLWYSCFCEEWADPRFWYPSDVPLAYGKAHESETRKRLRDEAKTLTPEWGPHCGVHERMPDRRDTGDRAQLRAEIDAYVAHLYGLSRDDFAYILDTFPVLKKKEMKAFGEFQSKRKCLEEFDRLAPIVGGAG